MQANNLVISYIASTCIKAAPFILNMPSTTMDWPIFRTEYSQSLNITNVINTHIPST